MSAVVDRRRFLVLALPMVFMLVCAGPLWGQRKGFGKGGFFPPDDRLEDDRDRYPVIPFKSGDLESLFKQQMERTREMELARKLLEQILKDPSRLSLPRDFDPSKVDRAMLERLKPLANDPEFQKSLREMSKDQLLKLQDRLKGVFEGTKVAPPLPAPLPPRPGPPPPMGGRPPPPPSELPGAAPWYSEERMRELLQDFFDGADEEQWRRLFQDSPGWQKTMGELQDLLRNAKPDNLPDMPFDAEFLRDGWDRVRSLRAPRLRSLRLPAIRPISLGSPSTGVGGGLSNANWQVILWLALAAVLAGVAWYAWQRLSWARPVAAAEWIGPWPIDPDRIATRGELRLAFEYLALRLLGTDARSWNHRRIAAGLGEQGRRQEARDLGLLYELARYTPGPEELTAQEAASARQLVATLNGAAA